MAILTNVKNGEGPGSSVGIVTGYGLDGPGIESRGGEIFRNYPARPWGPTSILYNWYRLFPGSKERPGRDADPSPPSSAVGHETSRAIPLLPLWAVRPIQNLSACTRVTFTFFLKNGLCYKLHRAQGYSFFSL